MPVRAFPSVRVLATCLLLLLLTLGQANAGGFAGQKLLVDTQIGPELSPVNAGKIALLPNPAGRKIQSELFVEGAHAHKTTRTDIRFTVGPVPMCPRPPSSAGINEIASIVSGASTPASSRTVGSKSINW